MKATHYHPARAFLDRRPSWRKTTRSLCTLSALLFLGGVPLACHQDASETQNGRAVISVQELGASLGLHEDTIGDPATTPIDGFVLGAVVLQERSQPYTTNEPLTQSLRDSLEADVTNSADLLQIVRYPGEHTIELELPEANAGNWQLMAIALGGGQLPDSVGDLNADDPEFERNVVFYGFTEKFLKTEDVSDTTVDLPLVRYCSGSRPPLGCASYDEDGNANVTTGVEVIDVIWTPQGGEPCSLAENVTSPDVLSILVRRAGRIFPVVVRLSPDSAQSQILDSTAEDVMDRLIRANQDLDGAPFVNIYRDKLEVKASHHLSKREPRCDDQDIDYKAENVIEELIDKCGTPAMYTIDYALVDGAAEPTGHAGTLAPAPGSCTRP